MNEDIAATSDDALALIAAATTILRRPQFFCRRSYALDSHGRHVPVDSLKARRFCLAGALLRAEHHRSGKPCSRTTSPNPQVDDLLLPVLDADAPKHLQLALLVLGLASAHQMRPLRRPYEAVRLFPSAPPPTIHHAPLILSVRHPRPFQASQAALANSVKILASIRAGELPEINDLVRDWCT